MPMTCNQNFILEKNNFIKKEECDILIKELKDKGYLHRNGKIIKLL